MPNIEQVIDFFLVTVMFKYIFVHGIADIIMRILKLILLRSKYEVTSWIHYSEGAMNHGHSAKNPHLCSDGLCKYLSDKNNKTPD